MAEPVAAKLPIEPAPSNSPYAAYDKRPVSLDVKLKRPVKDKDGKLTGETEDYTARRSITDAKAALEESDARSSKFDALAKCLL